MKLLLHFCLMAFVALVTGSSIMNSTRLFNNNLFKMSNVLVKKDSIPGASLDVKLTSVGNATMQAIVTNNGTVNLNLLHIGSLLDPVRPVPKVALFSNNSAVRSGGMRIDTGSRPMDFSPDSFTEVLTGQSITVAFDAATTYDLSAGGAFTAIATGQFRYAEANSTVVGPNPISYQSNAIEINVEASAIPKFQKRATIHESCEQWQSDYIEMSLWVCNDFTWAGMSNVFRNAHEERFLEHFKENDENRRRRVYKTLAGVHTECFNSPNSGTVEILCEDRENRCNDEKGIQAYACDDEEGKTVICNPAWKLPTIALECREVDFGGMLLHEISHHKSVISPPTEDDGYGYARVRHMGPSDSLYNADNYMYFSSASYWDCPTPPMPDDPESDPDSDPDFEDDEDMKDDEDDKDDNEDEELEDDDEGEIGLHPTAK